jgi:hypothetical protein
MRLPFESFGTGRVCSDSPTKRCVTHVNTTLAQDAVVAANVDAIVVDFLQGTR